MYYGMCVCVCVCMTTRRVVIYKVSGGAGHSLVLFLAKELEHTATRGECQLVVAGEQWC